MVYEAKSFPLLAGACRNWRSLGGLGRPILSLSLWKPVCLRVLPVDGPLLPRLWGWTRIVLADSWGHPWFLSPLVIGGIVA